MDEIIKSALNDLKELEKLDDPQEGHRGADNVLVRLLRAYGCPEEVLTAYDDVHKWYA